MQAGFGRTGKNLGFKIIMLYRFDCLWKRYGRWFTSFWCYWEERNYGFTSIGNMSSTHSANPMVCAAGAAVIDEIKKNDLLVEVIRKGKILHETLLL